MIRSATTADAERICEGNRRMARETEGLELDALVLSLGVRRALAGLENAAYLVYEVEGAVAGQLMVTTEWSDWRNAPVWWIQSVYVWPEHRGAGIYRALHAAVLQRAQEAGAAGVRLYVDERNRSAQAVYERVGMDGGHYRVFEQMFEGEGR